MPATAKSPATREERIAVLAHSFWEQDGRPDGRAEEHWFRAAVLVDSEIAASAAAPKKAATARKPRKLS